MSSPMYEYWERKQREQGRAPITFSLGGNIGDVQLTGKQARNFREQAATTAGQMDLLGSLGDIAREQAARRREMDLGEGLDFFNQQMQMTPDAFTRFGTRMSSDQRDVLARRRALLDPSQDLSLALDRAREGLQGFEAPALQAMREQQLQGVQRAGQTAARDLRGSLGALSGPARAAAQAQLQREQANRAANIEQQLLIEQANRQRQGLQDFASLSALEDQRRRASLGELEQSAFAARQEQLNREQLNRQLAQQELAARVGTQTGFAQMGAAEIQNLRNMLSGSEMAQAIEDSGGGKKSHFCLEFHKRGLISTRQLYTLTNNVIRGMFTNGDFVYWYMRNADVIAANANLKRFDWAAVANIIPTCLAEYQKGNRYKGDLAYMSFCQFMWEGFGKKFDVPPFKPSFIEKGHYLAKAYGTLRILMMPKTWTHLPKVLKSRIKHFSKGGVWNQAA